MCMHVCVSMLQNQEISVGKVTDYRLDKGLIPSRDRDFLFAIKSSPGWSPPYFLSG
jgi:hypothetical protein